MQVSAAQYELGCIYRDHARISARELWFRYFALTGMRSPQELRGILDCEIRPTIHEYNMIAVALNEYFTEAKMEFCVPYVEDWVSGLAAG
jgi:hypothetical protein